jgi:hypothetical protein
VTGSTSSTDFPTTPGAFDTALGGSSDGFVSKFAPDGKSLASSTYLGGSSDEFGIGIALDSAGSPYVSGSTFSADFPTTPGAFDTTLGGSSDGFVAKLSPDLHSLADSNHLGGGGGDFGRGIAVDSAGSAYATGVTPSGDFPTTAGAFDTTLGGSSDAYVAKLAAPGGGGPGTSPPINPPPPATHCSDRLPPLTTLKRAGVGVRAVGRLHIAAKTGLVLSGKSHDRAGPCPSGVRRVLVSLARVKGRTGVNCRFLKVRNRYSLTRSQNCRRPVLFTAKGTTHWTFRFPVRLKRGLYRVQARADDRSRNKETPKKRRNIVFFTVR